MKKLCPTLLLKATNPFDIEKKRKLVKNYNQVATDVYGGLPACHRDNHPGKPSRKCSHWRKPIIRPGKKLRTTGNSPGSSFIPDNALCCALKQLHSSKGSVSLYYLAASPVLACFLLFSSMEKPASPKSSSSMPYSQGSISVIDSQKQLYLQQ